MLVTNKETQIHLFNQMVRPNTQTRSYDFGLWSSLFEFSRTGSAWSVLDIEIDIAKWADVYLAEHEEWNHCGGATFHHNRLGMAYVAWAEHTERLKNTSLHDSPDFVADTTCGHDVAGDIGTCTTWAFLRGLQQLEKGGLWISVLSDKQQVVIEFDWNISTGLAYRVPIPSPSFEDTIMTISEFKRDLGFEFRGRLSKKQIDAFSMFFRVKIIDDVSPTSQLPLFSATNGENCE